MKKAFLIGVAFVFVVAIISLIMNDWGFMLKISGGTSIASLVLVGIFLGAFVSGDRVRANYYSETKKDREEKKRNTNLILAFALPNILASILLLLLTNN